MKRTSLWVKTVAVASVVLFVGSAWAGPKWDVGEDNDAWLQLSVLGQVHYQYNADAQDEEDFFLRRGRIILAGQIMDGVKFFVETDNDNAGKNGTAGVSTDIQDAFVDVRLMNLEPAQLWLEAGLILLPFSFENRASAASLLGIDYNAEAIRFVNTFVWRDYGADLRGNLGKWVNYRIGAFDGYDTFAANIDTDGDGANDAVVAKNDGSALRFTGHVAVNIIGEAENGWFFTQNQLGKATFISVGAGIDSQKDATTTTPIASPDDAVELNADAWVVDVQSGFKLGDHMAIMVNGAYYVWDNAVFEGNTAFVEAGFLVFKAMVTAKSMVVDRDGADALVDYTGGLHYFLKGHNARAGVEYTWGDTDGTDGRVLAGLQFLL